MVASYKRDLNRNYLVIKNATTDYQIRMLMENASSGFGKMKLSNWDGEDSIMYDVTGLQSMDRYFSRKKIGYDELSEILYSISRMVDECVRLLLDASGLIMNPEYIFWSINEEKPVWIFYPCEGNNISVLSEFILDHIDNTDSRVVRAAYELFKRSKDGSIDCESLYTLLEEEFSEPFVGNRAEDVKKDIIGEVREANYTSVVRDGQKIERVVRTNDKKLSDKADHSLLRNIIFRIRELLIRFFHVSDNQDEETDMFEYTREVEANLQEDNDETVLLNISEGYVHRLISRDSSLKDEVIDSFPCIIGSKKEAVDICINDKSVSRKHAMIDLFEGTLVLSDYSKNGTFVNGLKIQKEECLLKPGDEVSFGNIKYILS